MRASDDTRLASIQQMGCEDDVLEDLAHAVDFDADKIEELRRWIFDQNHQRVIDSLMVVCVPSRCPACFTPVRYNALAIRRLRVEHAVMLAPATVVAPMLLTYPVDMPGAVHDLLQAEASTADDRVPPRADLRRRFAAQVGYHAYLNHCPRCQHAVHDVELFGGRGPFARQPGELVEVVVMDDIDRPVHSGVMLAVDVSESLAKRIVEHVSGGQCSILQVS